MKFLCVPCDSPMKLQSVGPPERGSLSVVYACPACGYEMAMLTNAYETQVVQSLGVRIGPGTGGAAGANTEMGANERERASQVSRLRASRVGAQGGAGVEGVPASERGGESGGAMLPEPEPRCPFSGMIPGTDGARPDQAGQPPHVRWTPAAEARLANVPAFVRPMARTGIEQFARERGAVEVDERILDAAREFFGM
jgi:hypothetical protein